MVDEDGEVTEGEVVDGLPVVTEAGVIEDPPSPGALSVPSVQAAALAATGFVAGAATVAVLNRRRARPLSRRKRSKKRSPFGEVVTSNSFLVDVHLLRRD